MRRVIGLIVAIASLGWIGAADASTPTTRLVDVSSLGVQADAAPGGYPGLPSSFAVSRGGRFVAFSSTADNLVAGDVNGVSDVFVRDRVAQTTERVSVATGGAEGNGASSGPVAVSGDGRYVVFQTFATNLATGGPDPFGPDLLLRDRTGGTTRLVQKNFDAAGVVGSAGPVAVSDDGRFVAYNQFGGGHLAVMVRKDLQTGVVKTLNPFRIGEGEEDFGGMSADGNRVLFSAISLPEVDGVWVHSFSSGRNWRVDVNNRGIPANGSASSFGDALSADGRYALFSSEATNLVPHDTNHQMDVFVRNLVTHRTARISISSSERQGNGGARGIGISGHGRYRAFRSGSTNLVAGDTNGRIDLFIRDRVSHTTRRCSVADNGDQANANALGGAIARTGQWPVWLSAATNLDPADDNGRVDLFIHGPGC